MSVPTRPPRPLSFAQQQLWLLDRIRPGSAAYNVPRAFRVTGDLDLTALESALTAIVARHEALRTTFHETDGEPVHMVCPPSPVEVREVDLTAVPEEARENALEACLVEEARRPFDLTGDLLLRALVARLTEREHVMLLVLHHIASDAWSMRVLTQELEKHYAAALEGGLASLPPLPTQYADHATWQRERLAGQKLADEIGYWRQRLAGAPPALALPTDRPRPPELGDAGDQCTRLLRSTLLGAVTALARSERVTLFAALLAAFQALLHRYTGETDLVVGTASACRSRREIEPLIGYFVNTLPLRMTLDGDPTFRDLLRQASRVSSEALGHQDLPFERLVATLTPERHLDRSPIVQVMLVLHPPLLGVLSLPGLTVTPLPLDNQTAKFDLSLTGRETTAGLHLTAEYSTELFDAATIERLLEHFERLLEGAVGDPDRRVSQLALLAPDELARLESWSGTAANTTEECLHHLVAARAAASPDAVAVVAGGDHLTYAQLEARAETLARHLRALGVGPDVPAGVCMGRSLDLPVALYAVLKAGGAYLPLDPDLPVERVRFMLADALASVVIADAAQAPRLDGLGIRVVCPSTDAEEIAQAAGEPLEPDAIPEDLAYILYTSGSTGRPKGVMIPHRAIANHMRWMTDALPLTAADAVLQRTPIGFDASVWEFWAPLITGARLVMGGPSVDRDPGELARTLAEGGITVVQVVPSLLRALLDEAALDGARALRRVCCGGEALTAELATRCLARLPVELINLYGPTEATIDATWWRCEAGESTIPIGRPIAGLRAWVLDPSGRPVPSGVPGELHLGGAGLARGYLNHPELTAERFVPDPRSPEPGARLYRTGDRARWRADGVLEYLGRLDHQVKLRGMRIELGEVEAMLGEHPAVREAIAAVRKDAAGETYLVAWAVPRPEARLDHETLRHFLAEQLPTPMIPRAIVALDALPLTPHGKVNRAALPDPGDHDLLRAAVREAPASSLEEALAGIWTELLGVTEIGRRDDFFAIGGHSLLAARLTSRLRERLGVDVPVRRIFESPILADLAKAILDGPDAVAATCAVASSAGAPTLRTLIEAQARRAPDAPAIVAPGAAPLSYRDLLAQVDEVLATLATWGLGRGDRIALVMPQGPELAVAFVAVALGATAVPLNPVYREPELERYLTTAQVRAVIVPAGGGGAARPVAARLDLPLLEIEPRSGSAGRFTLGPRLPVTAAPSGAPRPDDVALALQTSGTTARPKVIPLTHANMTAAILGFVETFGLRPDDRALGVMPLFHLQGLMVVLTSLAAGGSVICTPTFDPTAVFDWIETTRPTWYSAVPTIHQAIIAGVPAHPEVVAGHALRFIRSSAAPLSPTVMAELERRFRVPVIEGYGQSESCMHVTSNPLPPGERRAGSVGRPVGGEVVIVDEHGRARPTGEIGEIQVRGRTVMAGYEDDPAANAAAFRDGWYRTGDLGRFDAAGYLYVTGRIKEMINRGGEKVSPREVDDALAAHPAVARAVTFPVPHPTLGEDVAAAIVLRPGAHASEAEIRRFVSDRLAPFKVPGRLAFVDTVPLGATGKPDRQQLATELGLADTTSRAAATTSRPAAASPSLSAIETRIATIWSELLGRPVAATDDFVALGGDSLRAALAIARMADALGVTVLLDQFLEAPTVAAVAARIAERLAAPAAGAQRLKARRLAGAPTLRTSLTRRDPGAPLPLSPPQQRLWFLHQLVPDSVAYHIPLVARLDGPLDVEALRRSFEVIVHRHEVLRTGIVVDDDQPRQRVAPTEPFALPLDEWPGDDAAAVERAAIDEINHVFDIARGPLIRARLFRRRADEHVLVVTLHHLISDGWSIGVLARELDVAYAATTTGRVPALPPLPLQYGDYAVWQHERLAGPELETQLAYWTRQLAGAPAALTMPADRPRPPIQSFVGRDIPIAVSRDVTDALRALARREGATLYMTLLAAFQVLLGRHAGQDEVLIGSPIAGRPRTELEGLIGFFANTVVLRGELAGDPTFCELLRRTRETALSAFANAELPFERLVEVLRPARDASRNPVFQAMLALQNAPRVALALAGLQVTPLRPGLDSAKVDYSLMLSEVPEGLRGTLEYCVDLFDAATAESLAAQLVHLLQEVARDADRPISQLPLLGEAERRRLVVDWNATRTPFPSDRSLPALFAEQVVRTPDAVAVTDGARTITYTALDRRARRLAHRLRDLGIGRGARVGVCCDRSIELVVALLGVVIAGAAYVPLDPTHPAERHTALLDDAGAVAVVTAGAGRGDARPEVRLEPQDREEIEAFVAVGAPELGGGDLAYVMYTSGSTGAPKGVAVPHRAVARLVRDTDYVKLGVDDVVAHVSNPAFDAATFEIWGALLNGARLVLIPPDTALEPRALADALGHEGVTTLFLTTALFHLVAREAPNAFRTLRHMLFGGETAEPRWVRAVLRSAPPMRLLNVYGPTETTTFATWHEVLDVAEGASTVPIGRPIANTEIYILDNRREPVPVGVAGEIYIGGPGLADGYLGRPDLTAERFVPHPFDHTSGARLYRTGDRGRFRTDGVVEFLGRLDRQIKLRGHRIEPDEIEAALLRLPEVGNAVVTVEGEASDTRRLVAYVAPAAGATPRPAEVRDALRRTLPGFMVPAAVVVLPTLPLTSNGKMDRAALPAPDPEGAREPVHRVKPSNATERTLIDIWEELLGVTGIGVRDSFFDLGGHSLLAARMMAAVEREWGRRVPLTTLFTGPTIEHLARALREEVAASEPPLLALNPHGPRAPFFFCHGDFDGGGFFTRALAEAAGAEQPFYAVHPHGLLGQDVPDTIEAMAAAHLADIRAIRPTGPYLLGGHCNGALVALEIARLLRARGEEVPLVIMLDASAPRRASRVLGGLARAVDALLRVPATRHDERLVRWRVREARIVARLRYYRGRLSATGGRPFGARLRALGALARKRVVGVARSSALAEPGPPPRPASPLAAHYERAVRRYIPARYGGRIVVLRSVEEEDRRPDLGWSSICPRVTTHAVPGGHVGAITRYVRTTAERLRACLEEVSRA